MRAYLPTEQAEVLLARVDDAKSRIDGLLLSGLEVAGDEKGAGERAGVGRQVPGGTRRPPG